MAADFPLYWHHYHRHKKRLTETAMVFFSRSTFERSMQIINYASINMYLNFHEVTKSGLGAVIGPFYLPSKYLSIAMVDG